MLRFLRATRLYILATPFIFIFLGAASNQLVMAANHDKFPVMMNEAKRVHAEPDANGIIDDDGHCVMTHDTHLNFLADWIDFHKEIDSPGDLLIDLGEYLYGYTPLIWALLMMSDALRRTQS